MDDNSKGKIVPQKVLRYFPLTPRLKRLYGCRHIAKEMRWHYTDRLNKEGVCVILLMEKHRKILILIFLLLRMSREMLAWDWRQMPLIYLEI